MRAGPLNRRITLQRFGSTRDEFNEPVKTWSLLAEVSASYEPLSDGERFRAGETAAGASARFRIRWSQTVADVSPKHRLIFEGVTHEIVHVKQVGLREGLELTTAARADG